MDGYPHMYGIDKGAVKKGKENNERETEAKAQRGWEQRAESGVESCVEDI